MDSFELNKILGATLACCLFVHSMHLFASWVFAPIEPAKPGFEIAVREEAKPARVDVDAEAPGPIEARLAGADADRGKSESKICMTCHTVEKGGPNKVGPNLWDVVGRALASEPGFDYSAAMKAKGGKWTFDELDKFLDRPRSYIPGTKMTFSGLQSPRQRANLIAYLRSLSDNPVPLPSLPSAPNPSTGSGPAQDSSQKNSTGGG